MKEILCSSCMFTYGNSNISEMSDLTEVHLEMNVWAKFRDANSVLWKGQIERVAVAINHYKFIYLLDISPMTPPLTGEAVLTENEFIPSALKNYTSSLSLGHNLPPTNTQYGDDAALLSVMGLVRLSVLSDPPS